MEQSNNQAYDIIAAICHEKESQKRLPAHALCIEISARYKGLISTMERELNELVCGEIVTVGDTINYKAYKIK